MTAERSNSTKRRVLIAVFWILGALMMGLAFGGISLRDLFFGR